MKKYRILPLLLIVCLLLTAAFPAAAAKNTADNSADTPQSTANVSSDGVPQSTVQAQEGSYVFGSDAVKSALDEKLQANCVLLVDEDSGQYYYTRNIDAKAYPASLTKIMTLLLAVEAVELSGAGGAEPAEADDEDGSVAPEDFNQRSAFPRAVSSTAFVMSRRLPRRESLYQRGP